MKKRPGFISILAMIVLFVTMAMIFYFQFTTVLETKILHASRENIQSFYNGEGKLLRCLYEKEYTNGELEEHMLTFFRNKGINEDDSIKIESQLLEEGDGEDIVKVFYMDYNDRKQMAIRLNSMQNFVKTNSMASSYIVNPLFERRNPLLDSTVLREDELESFHVLRDEIRKSISLDTLYNNSSVQGFESHNYSHIELNSSKLLFSRETMLEPGEEIINKRLVLILLRRYNKELTDLRIVDNLPGKEKSLSGVIYLEGNLNVSTDFIFNGIMIIDGGTLNIEPGANFRIDGLLINLGDEDLNIEDLVLNYSRSVIYQYGTYIPGFIDIDIDTIKSN